MTIRELVIERDLLLACERIGIPRHRGPGMRSLLQDRFRESLDVVEQGTGWKAVLKTEGGTVSLLSYAEAWAASPEGQAYVSPHLSRQGAVSMPKSSQIPAGFALVDEASSDPSGPEKQEVTLTRRLLFVRGVETLSDPERQKLSGQVADGLEQRVGDAVDAVVALFGDRNLSDLGRNTKLAEVERAGGEAVLSWHHAVRTPIQRRVEQASTELLSPTFRHRIPDGENAEDWRQREEEGRALLRKMDPLDRQLRYAQAAKDGNRELVRTFELASAVDPLVSDAQVREAAELFAGAVAPERFLALREDRALLKNIDWNAEQATKHLRNLRQLAVDIGGVSRAAVTSSVETEEEVAAAD